jgi:hypothetical protein
MAQQISFNVNAELYENKFGELAIRFPGERVYRVGSGEGGTFKNDAVRMLEKGVHPDAWREMPAHELLYGQNWHCISRLGYLGGDEEKPALELEVGEEEIGAQGKAYLREALH